MEAKEGWREGFGSGLILTRSGSGSMIFSRPELMMIFNKKLLPFSLFDGPSLP